MKKMRIHREEDCSLVPIDRFLRDRGFSEDAIAALPEDALKAKMRIFEEGGTSSPQLFESHVAPNTAVPLHSHEQDEIIYILDGEMILGNASLKKGGSLFVAANARYGFRAGPEGVKFLNFRPCRCDF